jgi:hypothetical protein
MGTEFRGPVLALPKTRVPWPIDFASRPFYSIFSTCRISGAFAVQFSPKRGNFKMEKDQATKLNYSKILRIFSQLVGSWGERCCHPTWRENTGSSVGRASLGFLANDLKIMWLLNHGWCCFRGWAEKSSLNPTKIVNPTANFRSYWSTTFRD